jgi:hypothetical protein
MNNSLFQQLLYASESDCLDFKQEQYKFDNATKTEKSKLIKDILAFANSWRRCDAYILIGVEEKNGNKRVVGISEHIDDAKIQQIVNDNTNRPIDFSYQQFEYENSKIGILFFPVMYDRPYYFTSSYKENGKELIKQNEVYVRRGSSTSIALPDEVSKMGNTTFASSVDFDVQFYDKETHDSNGESLSINHVFVQRPDYIPDFGSSVSNSPYDMLFQMPSFATNKNYHREYSELLYKLKSFFPVYLAVTNTGDSIAENVRIKITISHTDICEILEEYQLPDKRWELPEKTLSLQARMPDLPIRRRNFDGELEISKDANSYHIEVEYRHIQSQRTVYLDPFFISKNQSGIIEVNGTVFSQQKPKNFSLPIDCSIDIRKLTSEKIVEIGDSIGNK